MSGASERANGRASGTVLNESIPESFGPPWNGSFPVQTPLHYIRVPRSLVVPVDAIFDAVVLMTAEPVVHVQNVVVERSHGFSSEFVGLQNIQSKIHFVLHGNLCHEKTTVNLFRVGTEIVERRSMSNQIITQHEPNMSGKLSRPASLSVRLIPERQSGIPDKERFRWHGTSHLRQHLMNIVSVGLDAAVNSVSCQVPKTGIDDQNVGLGLEADDGHDGLNPVFVPHASHEKEAHRMITSLVQTMFSVCRTKQKSKGIESTWSFNRSELLKTYVVARYFAGQPFGFL